MFPTWRVFCLLKALQPIFAGPQVIGIRVPDSPQNRNVLAISESNLRALGGKLPDCGRSADAPRLVVWRLVAARLSLGCANGYQDVHLAWREKQAHGFSNSHRRTFHEPRLTH
ncbi:MAG: hypothetical protein A3K04_01425 [Gallionellales bacterium RBG_16_56_9]|nr:MAG: hypothetical protein A3K04_01425 [Gallionellales bacterium RBG_16_56_9]